MTFWLVATLVALWLVSRFFSPAASAQRIRDTKRKIYEPIPEPRLISADSYPHLDLDFYRATSTELQSRAFVLLGDIDPGRPVPTAKPLFIRVLASSDGTILASAYNYRTRGLTRLLAPSFRDLRTIDLESEFSDGTFVVTSNAYGARHVTPPPTIFSEYLEPATPVATLLSRHRERIDAHLAEHTRNSVSIASLAEALQSQERLRQIKAGFELQRGHRVSREELKGMATDVLVPGAHRAADEIAAQMPGLKPKK